MTECSYQFYNMRTQEYMGALPLYGVNCSDLLSYTGGASGAGTFTGSIRMDSDFVSSAQEILDITRPGVVSCWVYRDGLPIWSGPIWSRTYQSDGRVLQLNGQTFGSYLSKVVWYPAAEVAEWSYTANPHNIIRYLWSYLINEAQAWYNIGVTLEDYHQEGNAVDTPDLFATQNFVLKDRKFLSEYASNALQQGAEWRIRPFIDEDGARVAQFESGAPGALGVYQSSADSGPGYEYPGDLGKYWLTNSATGAANRIFGVGKTNGQEDIFYEAVGDVDERVGVDDVLTYDTSNTSVLQEMVQNDLAARYNELNRPVYELAEGFVDFDWALGDRKRVIIMDPDRFAKPMGGIIRLVGWSYSPPSAGDVEKMSVTIADAGNLVELNV